MTALHTIDLDYLGQSESIASYVLVGDDGPVLIETGPGSTVRSLESGLRKLGFVPSDVKHALVTHIHFDHAGAAGWMALHGATVYVHEFGAKHLVDPSKLIASAERIYKDRMDDLWGEILPVPEEQCVAVHDEDVLDCGDIPIRAIETPGHARHHHSFAIEIDGQRVAFTGDAGATIVAEAPEFISLPTPPPEFDLEQWIASVERLEREHFDVIYPTHFGVVNNPAAHLARVKTALSEHAHFIRDRMVEGLDESTIRDAYRAWFIEKAQRTGVPESKMAFYVKDSLAEMNVTGIMRYWRKRAETNR